MICYGYVYGGDLEQMKILINKTIREYVYLCRYGRVRWGTLPLLFILVHGVHKHTNHLGVLRLPDLIDL